MSAMAAAPPPSAAAAPRLDSVLSFSDAPVPASPAAVADSEPAAFSDAGSDTDADAELELEFAFAPPLSPRAGGGPALAPADDLFARGRIVAAYPLFDRHLLHADAEAAEEDESSAPLATAATAPPSPDTYCAWAPRSAPGSPARRDPHRASAAAAAAFPKSASTGEARRFWRLRDLVAGGGGRCHSDGKEKFLFLHSSSSNPAAPSKPASPKAAAAAKQGKKKTKKGGNGKATEMDMATAHRLFYGKPGAAAGAIAGDRPKQQSYLPYRPGIVGFFASARALGRSHHPY